MKLDQKEAVSWLSFPMLSKNLRCAHGRHPSLPPSLWYNNRNLFMSVEDRSEHQSQLDPPKEEQWEHAFGTAVRKAVDDLFTHRLIAEKVEDLKEDERVVPLLDRQKLILVERIEETAGQTLDNVL